MSQFKILLQNIGRSSVGSVKKGGDIATIRLSVHKAKPSIIVLTEIAEQTNLQGKNGQFRGFKCTQHAYTGTRSGAVAVFIHSSGPKIIENSIYNSIDGYFTIAAYELGTGKVIMGAVYGPSVAADNIAFTTFSAFFEKMEEHANRFGTAHMIVLGDLNVRLDQINAKPRTVRLVHDFLNEYNFTDNGLLDGPKWTWRRPGQHRSKSRIDYILTTDSIKVKSFMVKWGKKDHAELSCSISMENIHYKDISITLKDWAINHPNFLNNASDIITETLLDHDINFRLRNSAERAEFTNGRPPALLESELTLEEPGEGIFSMHVFQIILKKIERLQKKTQLEVIRNCNHRTEQLSKELGRAYSTIDALLPDDVDYDEIAANIQELKEELSNIAENKLASSRLRISNFEATKLGKNCSESFFITKNIKCKKNISKLIQDDGSEITDENIICESLSKSYEATVGKKFIPTLELKDFLERYEVELPTLTEEEQQALNNEITMDELKESLSSAKVCSAPGPSGHSISIYKFLFTQVPKLMLAAVNQAIFVPNLLHSKTFEWMLERRVIFICKNGKSPDRIANLRPLSLLESYYKILTRILTARLATALDAVLYSEQHGFRSGRSCQTALLPVLEAINDAEQSGQPLQLISFDIKGAFDTISPNVIFETMNLQQFPIIFAEALHDIAASGVARVFVNKILGEKFDVLGGSGQGDPCSAPRYTIGSDPSLRALQIVSEAFRYVYRDSGKKMPVIAYADDIFKGLNCVDPQQIRSILQVFEDFAKVSGLKISLDKTAILAINTDPNLLREITEMTGIKVVTEMKYLGIELRSTYEQSKTASFAAVMESLGTKYDRISSSYVDLFHRRQLIQTVFCPSINHVFMAFGLNTPVGSAIDGMVSRLLWTRKQGGVTIAKRRLVAKNRIAASFEMGGLQIQSSMDIAQGLLLNTFQRLRLQAMLADDDQMFYCKLMLEKLRNCNIPNLNELFKFSGSKIWLLYSNRLKTRSPLLSQMFHSYSHLLGLNEKSRESWLTAPIAGHTLSPDLFRITEADGYYLGNNGLTHVSQLFGECYFTGGIRLGENANLPQNIIRDDYLTNKCKILRQALAQRRFPAPARPLGSFIQIAESKKWSGLYRIMSRKNIDNDIPGPPAYFTRRRDGIPVPSLHRFMGGYNNLFKLRLSSKTLETGFNILNRVCWTNQKDDWAQQAGGGGGGNPGCGICGNAESTSHLLFECEGLSQPLWSLLSEVIVGDLDQGRTGAFRSIHAYHVMYNLEIQGLNPGSGAQIASLIQDIKRLLISKRYTRCTTGGAVRYGRQRLAANLIIATKKLIGLRIYQGRGVGALEQIQNALIQVIQ